MVSDTLSPLEAEELLAEEKPSTWPPSAQHGGLEAQARAGGGLEEQRGQDFAVALVGIGGGMGDDVVGRGDQLVDLLRCESCRMSIRWFISVQSPLLIQLSSEGSFRNCQQPGDVLRA